MTKQYFPFDAGAGANVTEAQWRMMARYWLATGPIVGVRDDMLPFADSTGMHVKVMAGTAWVQGHLFDDDGEETISVAANSSGDPRIDRLVLRADFVANTIDYAVLEGDPAPSPDAPALTQSTSIWEIPLCQVAIADGAVTIASGDVTDERELVQQPGTSGTRTGVHGYLTDPFTLADDTAAHIEFSGEHRDVEGYHDPDTNPETFTVPAGMGGLHRISFGAVFDAGGTGRRRLILYINDAVQNAQMQMPAVTGGNTTALAVGGFEADLEDGDTVKLQGLQDNGGPLDVNTAWMIIERIAPLP